MITNNNKAAEQLFVCQSHYSALTTQFNQRAVTHNDMIKSIQGIGHIDKQWLMQSINQDLTSRRTYQSLLQQLTFSYSDKQAAASTFEEFPKRQNDYFGLQFKRDKTFENQVYVLLSITHPLSKHVNDEIALHVCDENSINLLSFPPLSEGKTQQLLNNDDEVLKSLLNTNAELYLS